MDKVKIGITIGDMNGIGPEVIIKALAGNPITQHIIPIIYGSSKVMAYHKNIVKNVDFGFSTISDANNAYRNKPNVLNCWNEEVNIELGAITEQGGKFAHIALDRVAEDAKNGLIDAIVTAPIHKKAMQLAGFQHPGHTEFLTEKFDTKNSLMMMVSDTLRVALVTNHEPLFSLKEKITLDRIKTKLKLLNRTLRQDFGIEKPTMAVLGLNPHAGDDGAIGDEEEKLIRPVIIEAKKNGILAMGPYPADGFFGSSNFKKVDGILAMYHDQGLVPFKALSFGSGVNYTAGLPVVRTSPDHGTAYDLAGRNSADPGSMRSAINLAVDLVRNKKVHNEIHANPLKRRKEKTLSGPQ